MMKELNLNYFSDGISETEFNCFDIPIAAACGYYSREYYFVYLLYKCFEANWNKSNMDDISEIKLLESMGLEFEVINIYKKKDLLNFIKSQIDCNCPVLMPVIYNEMFFFRQYKKNQTPHLILINGYDTETGIIHIRESLHVISTDVLNGNKGLYPFRLKTEMLLDIWVKSNKDPFSNNKNKIFIIRKKERDKISSYKDLIFDFISNYKIEESKFLKKILNFKFLDAKSSEAFMEDIRLYNERYMKAFFYIIERYILSKNLNKNALEEFNLLKNEYLKLRTIFISKLQLSVLREKKFDKVDIDNIINSTNNMDIKIITTLKKIISEIEKNNDIIINGDYALKSEITASSEDDSDFCVNNVIIDNNRVWRSKNLNTHHWIIFQLPMQLSLIKIIITHDSNIYKVTKDFKIQGSNDGDAWVNLTEIKDNYECVTIHEIISEKYNYIRIYITLPSTSNTYHARIKKVEIYSNDN